METAAKRQEAMAEKLRKLAAKEAGDIERQKEKATKRLLAMHKAREKRQAAIIDAAEQLAKKTGEGMVSTLQQIKALVQRLRNERGMTEDDAIAQTQLAVDAVEKGKPANLWELSFATPLPVFDTV
jgi:hypothetical protein